VPVSSIYGGFRRSILPGFSFLFLIGVDVGVTLAVGGLVTGCASAWELSQISVDGDSETVHVIGYRAAPRVVGACTDCRKPMPNRGGFVQEWGVRKAQKGRDGVVEGYLAMLSARTD